MKKTMLFIFGIITLLLTIKSAAGYTTSPTQYIFADFGDVFYNQSGSVSYPSDGDTIDTNGWTDGAVYNYDEDNEKIGNMSINCTGDHFPVFYLRANYTGVTVQLSYYDRTTGVYSIFDVAGTYLGVFATESASNYSFYDGGWDTTQIARTIGWHNFTYYINDSYIEAYIDSNLVHNTSYNQGFYKLKFWCESDNTMVDEILAWHGHPEDIPTGTSPINLSSPEPASGSEFYYPTINLNVTGNFSYSTNCSLYISSVLNETVTGLTGNDVFINFTKTFSDGAYSFFFGCIDNETTADSATNTITINTSFSLDNCSALQTRGFNFHIINITDESQMNFTGDGYLGIYSSLFNATRYFNITWMDLNTTQGLCFSPSTVGFNLTGQVEFFAGSITKTYYFWDAILNNATQTVEIQLGGDSTLVSFIVSDENDNPVENAYITILYYDYGTNTYKTSEILKTDSQGLAIGNVVLSTVWYKFIITYNGLIYLETTPTKIITDTYSFQISLGGDYFSAYNVISGVACEVTFNNVTKCFSYTFSDSSGTVSQGCLEITRRSINNDVLINSSCVSASSSTINLCINENVSIFNYIGQGKVTKDNYEFVCGEEITSFSIDYKIFGGEGIMMTFLLTLTLICVGIWSPLIAVALMVAAIIVSIVLGIFYLSWGVLIAFIILGVITLYRLNR